MQVITGGFAQGKLDYALKSLEENQNISPEEIIVIDENNYRSFMEIIPEGIDLEGKKALIINHLNLIIKEVDDQESILNWTDSIAENCRRKSVEMIVISDELGCGIVPMDRDDRRYRENNGRVMCVLAAKAEAVTRLICGIPQKLK